MPLAFFYETKNKLEEFYKIIIKIKIYLNKDIVIMLNFIYKVVDWYKFIMNNIKGFIKMYTI